MVTIAHFNIAKKRILKMGILADRKKLVATKPETEAPTPQQSLPARVRVREDPRSLLPSPAPCPTCGLAILWLPTTLDAWRCPTCHPPPIRKMVAARVVLVDVDADFGISPQWFKLAWVEREGRRSLVTTPIRCEANGIALVDTAAGGDGGVAAADGIIQQGGFFIDESLGPPIGNDGNRLGDDEWFAAGASDVVWNQFFEGRK